MSSKFTNSQPTIEVKVNSPTANVGITDAEYNISLNPDVEADIFATKSELSAVENKIPAEYVKSAAVADNKLTLTKQDNTVVEFEGGGGSYTLPVASTTTLGGVKPDGTTITIDSKGVITANIPTKTSDLTNDSNFITTEYHDYTKQNVLIPGDNITISGNVISATQPAKYIESASATENTLTLYYNDNTHTIFTPTGGSGGGSGGVSGYAFSSNQILTDNDKSYVQIIVEKYPFPVSYHGKYYKRLGSTTQELSGVELDKLILQV